MADFYLDHGAYGVGSNRLGLDAPTWGVPQEGDGSGKDAATAASIGSIAFSAVPTTGTISVCGASVSTTGVLNAASADAAANALATNINATSAVVSAAAAIGQPQLRNLVYARGPAGGAPAGTCQIMMRIGSVALNYATNANAAIAHTLDGAPTVTQFAGGAGGCWGWFFNPANLGVSSSIGAATYGVWCATKPYVSVASGETVQRAQTRDDTIWARTGGANNTLTSTVSALTPGTRTEPLNIVFDSNTKWTADAADATFVVNLNPGNSQGITFGVSTGGTGGPVRLAALRAGGFKLAMVGGQPSASVTVFVGASREVTWINCLFEEDAATPASSKLQILNSSSGSFRATFLGCKFDYKPVITAIKAPILCVNTYMQGAYAFVDCEWVFNGSVADLGGIFSFSGPLNSTATSVLVSGCKVSPAGKVRLIADAFSNIPTTYPYHVRFDNNSGFKASANYIGLARADGGVNMGAAGVNMVMGSIENGLQRFEANDTVTDWDPDAAPAYPYLSATQPGSGAPWSLRTVWIGNLDAIPFAGPFGRTPKLSQLYVEAAAQRRITLEMFVPASLTIGSDRVVMVVHYVRDDTGRAECETTMLNGAALSASTAPWSNPGGLTGYGARKFQLTTSYAIRQNTLVQVELLFLDNAPGGANVDLYWDPEFKIEAP